MSTNNYYAPYWGELKAIASVGSTVYVVSDHKEGHSTAVFAVDMETRKISESSLPAGACGLVINETHLWVAGNDRCLYLYDNRKRSVAHLGKAFNANISHLALGSNDRLVVTIESELLVIDRHSAKPLQILELPATATALAVDPSGQWLAVGDSSGHISVFEAESQTDFSLSDKQVFHTGAVTALVFEEKELRFFSAGTDRELFLIHARGKLDAEDKGKSHKHDALIASMLLGPGSTNTESRLYTGGVDKVIKSWPVESNLQPGAFKDSVGKVVDLCWCRFSEQDHVVAITDKNLIQVFALDESGKIIDKEVQYQDVYAWAIGDFKQSNAKNSETSLKRLAKIDDTKSINLIAKQVENSSDKELRRSAATLLSRSNNLKSPLKLQKYLNHSDEKIRSIVFDSLIKTNGNGDYQLLDNALSSGFIDIASKAIKVLVDNANQDQQALNYLIAALQLDPVEIRVAALAALEKVAKASGASQGSEQLMQFLLSALSSHHGDMRKLALVRLYKLKLLIQLRVQSAIRLSLEDSSIPVRRTAFFILLLQQPRLSKELRLRDENIDRQLADIEQKKSDLKSTLKKNEDPVPEFSDREKQPLLQAMTCRQTDISMLGIHALALIHDPRAFALLLQLSRNQDENIRVEVCTAFKALADVHSIDRLVECLDDEVEAVRGAAFSALEKIQQKSSDKLIEYGFNTKYEDVHQRTMQVLVKKFTTAGDGVLPQTIRSFLINAINDRFDSIRNEAFKAILNKRIEQDEAKTLLFLLQSAFVDIRQAIFTELMANYKKSWAKEQLNALLNDEDSNLRKQAMEFLNGKAKKGDLTILELALKSRHTDIRMESVTLLIRSPGKKTDELLLVVINDKNKSIRQTALDAIISVSSSKNLEPALNSQFIDIKVRAAAALARLGRPVLTTLVTVLELEEPKEKEGKAEWVDSIVIALQGIAELEDSSIQENLKLFIDHKNSNIRAAAVDALIASASSEETAIINDTLLRHKDKTIRYRAALGLAYSGQETALNILFNEHSAKGFDIDRLSASIALGEKAWNHTISHLQSNQSSVVDTALRVLLMLDIESKQFPESCMRVISAQYTHLRAIAAEALENYSDHDEFLQFVTKLINTNGRGNTHWTIECDDIKLLAQLLVYGPAKMKARVVHLLDKLNCEKQVEWDYYWQPFKVRHEAVIQSVTALTSESKLERQTYLALLPVIYGTYAGLARDNEGADIRFNALNSLQLLLQQSHDLENSIFPIYLQSLNDNDNTVRNLAFDLLLKSDLPVEQACSEALSVMREDIGLRALQVLLKLDSAETSQIIEQVMLLNTDGLELKAAELLAAESEQVAIASKALNAISKTMRKKAISMLEAEYVNSSKAVSGLREALQNRFLDVRLGAAVALNRKHDDFAVKALFDLLESAEMKDHQKKILLALAESGRPEVSDLLLNFLENDKRGLADSEEIFNTIAGFRDAKCADRLLLMSNKHSWFKSIMSTLIRISGHDQEIKDSEDQNKDKSWIMEQHPRHDDILAKIVSRLFEANTFNPIEGLLPAIRWSQTGLLDSVLAKCCLVIDSDFARQAITVCGWRITHRKMTAEPLQRALQRPDTQIYAAIALAEAGINDGVSILLNTVQHEEDYYLRRSSVLALGCLGDERAVDLLLDLAKDSESILGDVACEAIGHLAKSERAYEIFELLKGYIDQEHGHSEEALLGLRWFNTEDAWTIIRAQSSSSEASYQEEALVLLAFNNSDETRKVLLKVIKDDYDEEIASAAYQSARQVFDLDDLTPEYNLLQNSSIELDSYYGLRKQLDIVCVKGSAQDILAILDKCNDEVTDELALALLQRPQIKLSDLMPALTGKDPSQASIAARLIGNIDSTSIVSDEVTVIGKSLASWFKKWSECRQLAQFDLNFKDKLQQQLSPCLERLCWLVGRYNVADKTLINIIEQGSGDSLASTIRLQAFKALLQFPGQPEITECATRYLTDTDAAIRTLCVEILLKRKADDTQNILEQVLADQSSIKLLVESDLGISSEALAVPASNAHYQGILLPVIVGKNDIEVLSKLALDNNLDDEIRLGAIEGLARLCSEPSELRMVEIAQALKADEDLCKAAWSGKRRSFRARMKLEAKS